jgi:hypothetical protein
MPSTLTLVVLPLVDVLKVVDPGVVVILAGEQEVIDVAGMGVRNGVAYVVSAALPAEHADVLLVSYLPKPTEVRMKLAPKKQDNLHMSRPPMKATFPSMRQSFSLAAEYIRILLHVWRISRAFRAESRSVHGTYWWAKNKTTSSAVP